ncbi:MAG: TIM barrel protein [Candidatus Hydrogenedentes bacterium]|nr:TIM barrel protein [Candidatus Hydrogenedentota bacterium]
MGIRRMLLFGMLSLAVGPACAAETPGGLANPFFAFKNSMETAGPASVEEQVKILADIGFDGFDNRDLNDLKAELEAIDRHGLKLLTIYFTVRIDEGETPFNPLLPEALPLLRDRGTILWCNTHSKQFKPSDPAGDLRAVPIFQQIADLAAPFGVRVAPYPHINLWVESPEDTARLADKVNRPNFGTSFNLFHWRALGDRKQPIEEVVRRVAPRMMVMSINGNDGTIAVEGISPLLEPQIDQYYAVLKAFRDAGYAGPVGLQCYRVPGDPTEHLRQSMAVWRKLKERFETASPSQ